MHEALIRMFNCEVSIHSEHPRYQKVNYNEVLATGAMAGYLVEPDAATGDVLNFLDEQNCNLNSTFYKQWEDVIQRNQRELYLEALKHYLSTYGSLDEDQLEKACIVSNGGSLNVTYNISSNGYVPNNDIVQIPLKQFKVIKAVTPEYVRDRILGLLESGIALQTKTVKICTDFLQDYNFLQDLNVNNIKNKEAQAHVCVLSNLWPKDPFSLLRCIVYSYSGSTMLIKSKELLHNIETSGPYDWPQGIRPFNLKLLTEDQLKSLASIFYRYKPIFLALKKFHNRNAAIVNKIRRYAVKYHKPLVKGFWETVLGVPKEQRQRALEEATRKVEDITNFKKVQLMQAIKATLVGKNIPVKAYNIRNGKTFIKDVDQKAIDFDYLNQLYAILKHSLVQSLKSKATTFTIPNTLHVACPTSEKNFLGNYPAGTYTDLADSDNVLGIYWRNEWGARDLDLHVHTECGDSIGWNSLYKNDSQSVIYSGDMTNADPEATELVYFKKLPKEDMYISLNLFNGNTDAQYKLFVAKENILSKIKTINAVENCDHNGRPRVACMCDPNNIVMEAMMQFKGSGENSVGYIHDNKLYLMNTKTSDKRVTSLGEWGNKIHQAYKVQADSYIDLVPLLKEAGFTEIPYKQKVTVTKKEVDVTGLSKEEALKKVAAMYNQDTNTQKELAEIDFTQLEKDTLISLFS